MIGDHQPELDALIKRYFPEHSANGHQNGHAIASPTVFGDDEVLGLCRQAKNANKFASLFDDGDNSAYGSASEAELALISIMSFFTQDPEQLDRLFRRSALMRRKWERSDYRQRTIGRALSQLSETYTPSNGHRTSYSPPNIESTEYDSPRGGLRVLRFVEMPDPGPREYLVEKLVPKGFTVVLHGDGGVAKSMIALSLGLALASNAGAWLGLEIEHGPVLYLDFELDATEQGRRVKQLAAGDGLQSLPEGMLYMSALGASAKEAFDAALEACREHDVCLLILDSLGPALEGDAEAARDVIGFYQRVVERFRAEGVTVLVIDHQSKVQAGERYKNKGAFGSVFKTNLARSVIQAEATARGEGALTVRLRQKKHNFGSLATPFEVNFAFSEEKVSLSAAAVDADELAAEQTLNTDDQILLALEQDVAFPFELAEATGRASQTVKNALTRLRKKQHVENTGTCEGRAEQVRITAAGLSYLRTYLYRGQVRKYDDKKEMWEGGF